MWSHLRVEDCWHREDGEKLSKQYEPREFVRESQLNKSHTWNLLKMFSKDDYRKAEPPTQGLARNIQQLIVDDCIIDDHWWFLFAVCIIVWMSLSISDFHVRCPISSHVFAFITNKSLPPKSKLVTGWSHCCCKVLRRYKAKVQLMVESKRFTVMMLTGIVRFMSADLPCGVAKFQW